MDALLNVEEVAKFLRMTKGAVYLAVNRRKLPVVKLGRRLRFRRADLEELLEQGFLPVVDDAATNGGEMEYWDEEMW